MPHGRSGSGNGRTGGCGSDAPAPSSASATAGADGHTAATSFTANANSAAGSSLALTDMQDFEDARSGLVATDTDLVVAGSAPVGAPVWRPKGRDVSDLTRNRICRVRPGLPVGDQLPRTTRPSLRAAAAWRTS